ncbi:MLP-like protein 423 [Henckelia pumila]|uniref:MLP-like protein 423 n=1 Tax=Henckelia pumila TaxID=405737 RepID=UPI003C6DE9EE
MSSTFALEADLKSKPQKIWESINDFSNLFPKIFPQVFDSVTVLEGDGNSPGSVRRINYAKGVPLTPITQKIESVDEEAKKMTYSVVDGDILKLYKSFRAHFAVSGKDEGTLVIYSGEYEKINEQVQDPGEFTGIIIKSLYGLDAYLLQAEKS